MSFSTTQITDSLSTSKEHGGASSSDDVSESHSHFNVEGILKNKKDTKPQKNEFGDSSSEKSQRNYSVQKNSTSQIKTTLEPKANKKSLEMTNEEVSSNNSIKSVKFNKTPSIRMYSKDYFSREPLPKKKGPQGIDQTNIANKKPSTEAGQTHSLLLPQDNRVSQSQHAERVHATFDRILNKKKKNTQLPASMQINFLEMVIDETLLLYAQGRLDLNKTLALIYEIDSYQNFGLYGSSSTKPPLSRNIECVIVETTTTTIRSRQY